MDLEEIPWWGWALGLGVIGAGAAGIAYLIERSQPTPPLPAPSTPSTPSPSAPTSQSIELTDGPLGLSLAPGTSLEMTLPAGARWDGRLLSGGITVVGSASVGSAPTQGTNPASIVYNGGGAIVTASWWAPESTAYPLLLVHSTILTLSDA